MTTGVEFSVEDLDRNKDWSATLEFRNSRVHIEDDGPRRPRQCASTMIIDTQAGFRMTFTVVLMC